MTSAQSSDYVSGSPLEIGRAALDPATGPTSESGCTAAKGWPPAASTTPFVTPDLAHFHGLLEAIEDMHNQPDVGTLLSAVADYGMTIIPADGIAIIKRTAGGFRPVVIREAYEPDIVGVEQVVELVAAEGGFQHVHRVDDLSQDRRWGKFPLPSSLRTWRSFLMVASERQAQVNTPVTFVWWSRRTSAFADQTDIAVLFARAAGLAIHIVNTRDNLVQAVLARHRAGVAQGILMSRLGCSQDQAIAILKHRSQRTNRKLRIIADEVIRIGDLKPAPTKVERNRLR